MRLLFRSPYLSIKAFPTVDLPPFSLLTGLNGAGKSHFLEAVRTGHVTADCAPIPDQHITAFNWTNMVPGDSGQFDGQTITNERSQIWSALEGARHNFQRVHHGESPDSVITRAILAAGLGDSLAADPIGTLQLDEATLATFLGDPEEVELR